MREIPASVLSHLQERHGTEPLLIIEVQWVDNGPRILYSDQKLSGANYPYPTIIQVSDLDMASQVDGAGDSQQINIILDDIDGKLKTLIDGNDIHKRPVWVYQGFQGLTIAHKFLLFKGEISSPIIWSEGERTLTFDVLTRQEDTEVAFSMEEGNFENIPEEALGQVWPLVFGEVCNMQATQVRAPRRGILTQGEGVHDFTIPARICQARYIQCANVSAGEASTIAQDANTGAYVETTSPTFGPDLDCVKSRYETICNLEFLLEQQLAYEHLYLNIRGGAEFPQGETVTLNINGALFTGYFNGTEFRVMSRTHPDYETTTPVACVPIPNRAIGLVPTQQTDGWKQTATTTAWYFDIDNYEDDCETQPILRQGFVGGPVASQEAFDNMPTANFFWIPPGTEVYLEDEAEILYIVSLLPATINHVAAYKTQATGRKLLLEVPADYYTVYETDYTGYTVTEIGLNKKLSACDSDWDDNLYISLTSDIGPNPVDIIEWLIDKYTSLTVDTSSFDHVRDRMVNYPTNFGIKERRNVLTLIQDIAYQTRCAIYTRNDIVYIKYLSEEPTSVRTLTGSDIGSQTFRISHTPTEDIVTKHTVKWQPGEAGIEDDDTVERTIVLKYNVPKYGVQEESHNYYTQNTYDTILKSATFWLIRRSHTWKYIEFDTTIKHLDLELFDCITLNLPQFSAVPIKCVITHAQFNNANNTVHFQAWTPVRAGTSEPYFWAWPADQEARYRWPLPDETQWAEPGGTFAVTPPLDHILSGGDATQNTNFVVLTSGDRFPADSDDSFPTPFCEISDFEDANVGVGGPTFQALKLAEEALARANTAIKQGTTNALNKGGPNEGDDEEEKEERNTACGKPVYGDGCIYEVTVTFCIASLVTSGKNDPKGGCEGGPCWMHAPGYPCMAEMKSYCYAFGARYTAEMFRQSKLAEIKLLQENCGYHVRVAAPYLVSGVKAIVDPSTDGGCEESPGDPSRANQGFSYVPMLKL